VAAFGAFVDIGVHQDGLVHVSALSNTFVKDPREVVKSGDVVKVRVVEVDEVRKRISLTMRLEDKPEQRAPRREPSERGGGGRPKQGQQPRQGGQRATGGQQRSGGGGGRQPGTAAGSIANSAMADALRRAGLTKE